MSMLPPEPNAVHTADTMSSDLRHRPIKPLPKRRLRERLTPDVADAIQYPPEPQSAATLFYYPYNLKEDPGTPASQPSNVVNRANRAGLAHGVGLRRGVFERRGDGDGPTPHARGVLVSRPHHILTGQSSRVPPRSGHARPTNPQAPPSAASSMDGYDSFENTNNKKKRKIPTAGETALNSAHALHDAGVLGVALPIRNGDDNSRAAASSARTPYQQSGMSNINGQGISGPGRGRFGRVRSGRNPLQALPDPNTTWAGRNASKLKLSGQPLSSAGDNRGIISNAIASAGKLTVPQGQEHISLLRQPASSRNGQASTQFTFTFGSQVPGTVSWPGSDGTSGPNRTQHTSMPSDHRASQPRAYARGPQNGYMPSANSVGTQTKTNGQVDGVNKGTVPARVTPKKSKRRGNSLLRAARQRRQQAEYQNEHHPPAPEDVWICEFCEYERIFGRPPEALIRQYEIKDRRRRREEAERRRLLEKAKMKSRKGKKTSKAAAKNHGPVQDRNGASAAHVPAAGPEQGQEPQSEEFDEEDLYEEEGTEETCPAPVPGQRSSNQPFTAGDTRSAGNGKRLPVS